MGSAKATLIGLFVAVGLIGFFLVVTIVITNSLLSEKVHGLEVPIAFVMGFACARAFSWFLQYGRRRIGQ